MRIKICRKEAKESCCWLRLIFAAGNGDVERERGCLMQEAAELTNIFGAILRKAGGEA